MCVLSIGAAATFGQDGGPAESNSSTPLRLTGVIDTFYSLDLNHPTTGLSQFRNFDWKQGLQLNAAELSLERDGPRFGFRLDAGYGETFRIMNLSDPWGGPNRYISQAYISYKPAWNGLRLDFGKFYTSIGAESPDSYRNLSYSQSLLSVLGGPFYHFGLRATIPITKSFTAGVQLVNGCNDVRDKNSGKTVGLTSTLTRANWSWSEVYMTGPEKPGINTGYRHLYDSVLTVSPIPRATGYLEGLFAIDRRLGAGSDKWGGAAAAVQFKTSKRTSLSLRAERFNDSTGFNTGTPQHLEGGTVTFDYRPASSVIARTEFRRDWSNRAVFDWGGEPFASKTQTTMLVALIFSLTHER